MAHEQFILYYSSINKSLNKHLLKPNVKKNQCGHWHDTKRWALSKTPLPGFLCWCTKQPELNNIRRRFLFERGIICQWTMSNIWWWEMMNFSHDFNPRCREKEKVAGLICLFPYFLGRGLQFLPQTYHSNTSKRMSALKHPANKRTWKTFLLLFHYFGAVSETLKTPPRSELMDEDGNKYS